MQGTILFTLFIVVGLAIVWMLFLRNTRAAWELAVMIAGTLALLVLAILMVAQPRAAVPQTVAATSPLGTPGPADSAEQATVSSTAAAVLSATVFPTPSQEAPTPSVTVSATTSAQLATATSTPTMSPTVEAVSSTIFPTPTITLTQEAIPTATRITAGAITAIAGASGGNIRSAPVVGDNIIGFVESGDEVLIVGEAGGWYLVRLGPQTAGRARIAGGEGWIVSSLLEDPSGVPPQITVGPPS